MYNHIPFNHNPHITHIYTHQNGSTLWLGDQRAARDQALLRRLNITAVLTAAQGINLEYMAEGGKREGNGKWEYLLVRVLDMPSYRISQHFGETNKFVHENLVKGRNVLVHCAAGISRSVTILIAYLIRKLNFTYKTALAHIQSRRPSANPNYGFVQELKKYEYRLSQKDKRVYSSMKSELEDQHNNVISSLIQRKREEEKRKLGWAFQVRKGDQGRDREREREREGVSLSFDRIIGRRERYGSGRGKYESEKIIRNDNYNLKQKLTLKIRKDQKPQTRKRVDTENNILFPKIVLVKKLDEMNKKH